MCATSAGHGAVSTWELRPALKYAAYGVVRTVPPADTVRRALPLMKSIGVTRIGEVTHLDRVGIPNYMAVRPGGRDGISYYNGKGGTTADAKAGALMEAIERASGERCDLPIFYCTKEDMARRGPVVDPAEIVVPRVQPYEPGLRVEWVEGFDLIAGQPTFVPLNAVVCPYEPPDGRPMLHYASSNGLASGNTMEEALAQALCEVIERDAEAVAHTTLKLKPAVDAVLAKMGLAPARGATSTKAFSRIALESLPARPLGFVTKLTKAGLKVYLRNTTATAGIPTFDCVVVEQQADGTHLAHSGCGTHPDARVAVTRAITEAAQSRVACIQGGREDLPEFVQGPISFDPDEAFGGGACVPFASIPSFVHDDISEDIRFMLKRLVAAGFSQVVVLDLTRPDLGIPVVRVVIPKAEAWPVFQMHAKRGVFGARVAELLRATHAVADDLDSEGAA